MRVINYGTVSDPPVTVRGAHVREIPVVLHSIGYTQKAGFLSFVVGLGLR